MESKLIYGIQQIGVGVENAEEAFEWYATRLGSDILAFDDSNEATYMAPYMGGKPHKKRAVLAINLQGGGGYEIWQYLDRKPKKQEPALKIGDLGIAIMKVKSRDIEKSCKRLKVQGVRILNKVMEYPDGKKGFCIEDPYGNIIEIKEYHSWYGKNGGDLGGVYGCTIGVSDIENSRKLFSDILGYDKVVFDEEGTFDDLSNLPSGTEKFRRVLLTHSATRSGGFSRLFGETQLELIQCLDRTPVKIFEGRYWGDLGYIHVCFDIKNMNSLVQECSDNGFPFKVLSKESFDMGDANGHWGYLEDPDGTLIEFVETNKVPLLKSVGLNINLKNRDPKKPLPNWLVKAMAIKRVKFPKK